MRATLNGWRRHCGTHTLVNEDISELELLEEPTFDPVRLNTFEDTVTISARAQRVLGQGNYCFDIQLTKAEVINLARIMLRDDRFAEVAQALSRPAAA
jgi:hypothetical protein